MRIVLTPSLKNSGLINLIEIEDRNNVKYQQKIKHKIEQSILPALRNKYPNIININLYIIDNKIVLTISRNDKLFSLPEEMILAKLAVEYNIDNLNEICRINHNFAKACRSDLFWWELIKLKFPQYYKEKRNYNYDPRELIRGLKYINERLDIDGNIKFSYDGSRDSGANKIYRMYHSTLEYVLFENIFIIGQYIAESIITRISEIGKSINFDTDLEIIKFLFEKRSFDIDLLHEAEVLVNDVNGLKLMTELDKWLISKGETQLNDIAILLRALDNDLSDIRGNNSPEYYELLSKLLNKPQTDDRYLNDYSNTDIVHRKLREYILSQVSPKVDKDLLIDVGIYILRSRNSETFESFESFYEHFNNRWTNDDIKIFRNIIVSTPRGLSNDVKKFDKLVELY